jgi:hypothetical protein
MTQEGRFGDRSAVETIACECDPDSLIIKGLTRDVEGTEGGGDPFPVHTWIFDSFAMRSTCSRGSQLT